MQTTSSISAAIHDSELLADFARTHAPEPFAEIVRRHGGMVQAVCRSVLGNSPEVDDASQAVFLTLAQKAASGHVQRHLVGWLHRVAWYVAARASEARSIRRRHEQEAAKMRLEQSPADPDSALASSTALHNELAALPEKYRVAILLHHIEGRTQEETAALLGVGVSTAGMRLNRGRALLRERLARRGIVMTALALGASLATESAAHASPAFVANVTLAVTAMASPVAAAVSISSTSLALSKGALNMLYWSKLKLTLALSGAVMMTGLLGTYVTILNGAPPVRAAAVTTTSTTAPAVPAARQIIKVTNATELVAAIGSDRIIQIAPGDYDITAVPHTTTRNVRWGMNAMYSDDSLVIRHVENLTLECVGDKQARLFTRDTQIQILNFVDAAHILLKNIEMVHEVQGGCSAGVLSLADVRDITIENCTLSGCGTQGIEASEVNGLLFKKSVITHCSMSILTGSELTNVRFEDSDFSNNKYDNPPLTFMKSPSVSFTRCTFTKNELNRGDAPAGEGINLGAGGPVQPWVINGAADGLPLPGQAAIDMLPGMPGQFQAVPALPHYPFMVVDAESKILFESCTFTENQGDFFYRGAGNITIKDCKTKDNGFTLDSKMEGDFDAAKG